MLKLNSVTLLNLLSTYGSPAKAIADPKLAKTLRLWGKKYLKEEKIAAVVLSARRTKGLPMNASEISWMQELAAESLRCHREQLACDKIIQEQVASSPVMQRSSDAVGAATLAVLWSEVGDPVAYSGEHRKMKGLIAIMRKLCKSLWHARVHNKDFDYSLVINGVPLRRRRRRRKAAKKAA